MSLDRRHFLNLSAGLLLADAPFETTGVQMPDFASIELRQYTLYGGRRDTLIELFERAFVAPQEAAGAHLIGSFRDLDDPDRFVWLRGFRDLAARKTALETFYGGPVWQENRGAANATMLDSDNVLLLRPAFAETAATPAHLGSGGLYGVTIHYLAGTPPAAFADFFRSTIRPRIERLGVQILATLATEAAANNFPRLPVRENEPVLLWLARWNSQSDEREFRARFDAERGWRDAAAPEVLPALMRKPECLRLQPTGRSALK